MSQKTFERAVVDIDLPRKPVPHAHRGSKMLRILAGPNGTAASGNWGNVQNRL
ncbi:hypothetical protein Z947_2526 [Sulfitobacter geojensis]|nr:hypothetical protein Z947_2526 [Sulfitobacter geojensis]